MQNVYLLFFLFLLQQNLIAQPVCVLTTCGSTAPTEVSLPGGDFEDAPVAPLDGRITFYAGETYSNWSVLAGSIDLLGPDYADFTDGNPKGASQFIDLNGFEPATIATTLSGLIPGNMYTIELWYAKNDGASSASCNLLVANGAWLNAGWTATNDGGDIWLEKCFTFTAQAGTAELRLVGSSTFTTAGMLLDNITLWRCPTGSPDTTLLSDVTCDPAKAGVFVQNLTNMAGYDSIVINTINLLPTDTLIQTFTTCDPTQTGVTVDVLSNQFGCDSIVLMVTGLLQLSLTVDISDFNGFAVSCSGSTDGSARIVPVSGTPPFSYAWSNGSQNPEITGVSAGNYLVTVTDNKGCSGTAIAVLDEPDPLLVTTTVVGIGCSGASGGSIRIGVTGGATPYRFSLDNMNFQATNIFRDLPEGAYTATTTDANGCSYSEICWIETLVPVEVSLGADITVELGDQTLLQAVVSVAADDLASVLWSISDSMTCSQCLDQLIVPLVTGAYLVRVAANNGCTDADTVLVVVDRSRKIYVPNAFSPNDDGVNDILMIFSKPGAVRQVKSFQIFDRWGEVVFRRENFQPNDPGYGWNGVYRGQAMSPGVYVWVAEIEFVDGVIEVFGGDATVVR
jgi:gliding motility-associated-like protein